MQKVTYKVTMYSKKSTEAQLDRLITSLLSDIKDVVENIFKTEEVKVDIEKTS